MRNSIKYKIDWDNLQSGLKTMAGALRERKRLEVSWHNPIEAEDGSNPDTFRTGDATRPVTADTFPTDDATRQVAAAMGSSLSTEHPGTLQGLTRTWPPRTRTRTRTWPLRTRTRTRTWPQGPGQGPDPQGPGQGQKARQIILIAHFNLSNVQWWTCLSFIS